MGDIKEDIKSSFPNEKAKAMINIMYTANFIQSHQNEFFKPYGISPQQFNILRILRGAGEALKVQTVKERMIERSPNATRLMDKLCTKGLIDRVPCPTDRRVVHVKITSKGLKLLDKISTKEVVNIMDKLSSSEAKKLSDLLDKVR